jgi:hypothetical protein
MPTKTPKEYPPLFCILLDLDKERGVKYSCESANIKFLRSVIFMVIIGIFGSVCVAIPVIAAVIWDRYHTKVQQ